MIAPRVTRHRPQDRGDRGHPAGPATVVRRSPPAVRPSRRRVDARPRGSRTAHRPTPTTTTRPRAEDRWSGEGRARDHRPQVLAGTGASAGRSTSFRRTSWVASLSVRCGSETTGRPAVGRGDRAADASGTPRRPDDDRTTTRRFVGGVADGRDEEPSGPRRTGAPVVATVRRRADASRAPRRRRRARTARAFPAPARRSTAATASTAAAR